MTDGELRVSPTIAGVSQPRSCVLTCFTGLPSGELKPVCVTDRLALKSDLLCSQL